MSKENNSVPSQSQDSKSKMLQSAASCRRAGIYLTELIKKQSALSEAIKSIKKNKVTVCSNLAAPARPLLAQAIYSDLTEKPPILWITPNAESAEKMIQDAYAFLSEAPMYFPEKEHISFDQELSANADPDRMAVLQKLEAFTSGSEQLIIIAPLAAVLQPTVLMEKLEEDKLIIKRGESADSTVLSEILSADGYRRTPMVEGRGEYSVRGGIIDIYPITGHPVRIELFGDEIESIKSLNIETQRSSGSIDEFTLMPTQDAASDSQKSMLTDYLKKKAPDTLIVLDEPVQLRLSAQEWLQDEIPVSEESSSAQNYEENSSWQYAEELIAPFRQLHVSAWNDIDILNGGSFSLQTEVQIPFINRVEELISKLPQWRAEGSRTVILSSQYMRLKEILAENEIQDLLTESNSVLKKGQTLLLHGFLNEGWRIRLDDGYLEILSDREIIGQRQRVRKGRNAERSGSSLRLDELAPGDYVVHIQHGIAKYTGVQTVTIGKITCDMLKLEYAKGDSLLVPADQLDLIQKYEGPGDQAPAISRLGTGEWKKTKSKVKEKIKIAAEELIKVYAARAEAEGFACEPDDNWQIDMESAFPYQETPDQLRAIEEVKADQESSRPMDRLICGDVGYGKTEVAIRAAFKMAMNNRQTAILVPTTILAQQHFQTFSERLAPYPIKIGLLSRFRTRKEIKQTLEDLALGECDILIGTHRMLQKDVQFNKLGLLIIDEEHRFGVAHKTKLKKLKANIDVLTMSATPIPRTLQMSFYGIREMSLIETPPEERLPVKTYLFERRDELIKAAVSKELSRQGQVYFLHNRVESIERTAAELKRILPKARVTIAHGQMSEAQLEDVMMDFYEGHYDILVCTSIIESGLDIPNVNTIIIDNAQNLGLAQLYQMRGRVGRSSAQGYCYLLCPPSRQLSQQAQQRINTIKEFTKLGAGFQIAKRDLEIRGSGNMLGAEQSGNAAAVGFSLYCKMLEDAVRELRREQHPLNQHASKYENIILELPISASFPDSYIETSQQKVALYRRLALIHTYEALDEFAEELRDRYGELPEDAENLISIVRIKIKCNEAMIPSLRINYDQMLIAAPFLRPLAVSEIYKLSKLTGWKAKQQDMALIFDNLFDRYEDKSCPPAKELIAKITDILETIKQLPEEAPQEPAVRPYKPKSRYSGLGRYR